MKKVNKRSLTQATTNEHNRQTICPLCLFVRQMEFYAQLNFNF